MFHIQIKDTRYLIQFQLSFNIQRVRHKVMKSLLLITRSLTNIRFSRTFTRKISSLLIIYNRSSNNTNAISNIRRFRSTRQHNQIRITHELINRRSLEVIRVHPYSNSTLHFTTKRLVKMIIFLTHRPRHLRCFKRRQFSNKATYTSRFGYRNSILPCHLIIRRLMVLRSGTSLPTVVQRLPYKRTSRVITNSTSLTVHNFLLTGRRTRRNNLTKAKHTRGGSRVASVSIGVSIVRYKAHTL